MQLTDKKQLKDLAFEVALRYYTPQELQVKYRISETQFEDITTRDGFKRLTLAAGREIDESGKQFKVLARKLATESLPNLFSIAQDPQASHADRIAAINALAKYSGFEKEQQTGNTAFQVNINLS